MTTEGRAARSSRFSGGGPLEPYLQPQTAAERVSALLPAVRKGAIRLREVAVRRLVTSGHEIHEIHFDCKLLLVARGRTERRPLLAAIGGPAEERPLGNAADPGPFGPLSDLAGFDEERGVRIRLSPADDRIPTLPALFDRAFLCDLFEDLLGHPGIGPDDLDGRVVGHRFGRRLTLHVRAHLPREEKPRDFIAKVFAGKRDRKLLGALRHVGGGPRRLPFRIPRAVYHDPRRRLVICEHIPGCSFFDDLDRAGEETGRRIGSALSSLHRISPGTLPVHGREEEFEIVRKAAGRAGQRKPHIGMEMERLADGLRSASRGVPDGPPITAHRDFYDKQVVLDGREIGFLDWDLTAASPRAVDVGNFLAHLRLRSLQGRLDTDRADEARRGMLQGYGEGNGAFSGESVRLYERLALLRLAGVYALRSDWPATPHLLLRSARAMGEERE